MKFDYIIHYTGYERKYMNLFACMDGVKMIYVHNNLIKESASKDNIHLPSLRKSYNEFDKIVIIRDSMKEELLGSLGENADSKDVYKRQLIESLFAEHDLVLMMNVDMMNGLTLLGNQWIEQLIKMIDFILSNNDASA